MVFFDELFSDLGNDIADYRGESRDNVMRNLLESPEWADYNQSEARQIFRDAGFKFRDTTFNNIWNSTIGAIGLPTRINRLGLNTIPTENHLFESQYSLPQRYRFTIKFTYEDEDGSILSKFMTVNDSELKSIGSIISDAEDYILSHNGAESGAENVLGIEVNRGFIDRSKSIQ